MSNTVFRDAIAALGKQAKAAERLGRSQSTISDYVRTGKPPADICMKVEMETGGQFKAEDMRPDLADVFKGFRQGEAA